MIKQSAAFSILSLLKNVNMEHKNQDCTVDLSVIFRIASSQLHNLIVTSCLFSKRFKFILQYFVCV